MRPRSPMLRAALLTGVLGACAAPAAHADSIVYIQDGNVWAMKGDGGGKVQLTDGGQWHSPTQADDGTIAAVQGQSPIVVMAKDGRVLRTIKTPMAKSGDGGTFAGAPVSLAFSPDGRTIAYSYVANSCPVASSCGTIQRSTFYTRADATPNATPIDQFGNQFGAGSPEWITNDRTLVFGGAYVSVNIDTLDAGDYNYATWIRASTDIDDGELSRDRKKLALLYGYGNTLRLGILAVSGDPATEVPPQPAPACETGVDEKFNDPTWSPDGNRLAVGTSTGIEVLTLVTVSPNLCDPGGESVNLAPAGATSPDWGPADPATARYLPPPDTGDGRNPPGGGTPPGGGGTPPGGGGTPPGGGTPDPGTSTARLRPRTAKLRTVLAKGLRVTVTGAPKGRLSLTAKRGKKTVARGSATVPSSGKATVTLRFTRASRKALRKTRTVKLTIAGGGARATVTLRR